MEIIDVASLISIRTYVIMMVENLYVDNAKAKELRKLLPLIDKKIVDQLLSDEYKTLFGANDLEALPTKIKNIKSSLIK